MVGGIDIMQELSAAKKCEVLTTSDIGLLPLCDHFLVYLHDVSCFSGASHFQFKGLVGLLELSKSQLVTVLHTSARACNEIQTVLMVLEVEQ